jgi:chorismate mutase/prephenate dehydratase
MPRPAALTTLRQRIDRIDDRLLALLNERATLALAVAARKAESGRRVYAPDREKAVLRRLLAANDGPLKGVDLRAIFGEIISASRGMEARLRVAYLGPEATYTHLAARRHFGQGVTFAPADTIPDVFREVEAGTAQLGVVPVENSTEGMVAHTLDLLVESPLAICGEIVASVSHCVLARPGTTLDDVRRVAAHPQALAQCRRWLATHLPQAETVQEVSNARAAARAATEAGTVAIGAAEAGRVYKLRALARGIQDERANLTRFLVLGPSDADGPTDDDKTSVVLSVRDEVGVLVRMLTPFATHGVDLIKIESRPLRDRPWEYYFFLDLKGHRRSKHVAAALAAATRRALKLRILGSYPAAEVPQ